MSIKWRKCSDFPLEVSNGRSAVANGKVYYLKGSIVSAEEKETPIYCYDPIQDQWSTLPPLTVRLFGLGHVDGKPVTLGGLKLPPSMERINDVYTLVENTGKWKKIYPPMPTARSSPMVFSIDHALIVVGGYVHKGGRKELVNIVEVFKVKESQWYRASALPPTLHGANMFGTVHNSDLYLVGGLRVGASYSKVSFTSISDLTNNTVPANHKNDHSNLTVPTWKILPHTPTNKTAITSLAGLLITLGGEENTIHMYSPSIESWVHVGSLPEPRLLTTISVISPMEILMIGGFDGSKDTNTVYKGTLQLSM
jgi:N-acetylneuraminic acid mutarotase